MKIAHFLRDYRKRNDNHPLYLRVFLLRHAYHISDEVLDILDLSTDIKPSRLSLQHNMIKEKVTWETKSRVQRQIERMGNICFDKYKYVKEKEIDGLTFKGFKSEEDYLKYLKLKGNEIKLIKNIREVNYLASYGDIETIGEVKMSKAHYAYNHVIAAIQEYFADDTYWGSK